MPYQVDWKLLTRGIGKWIAGIVVIIAGLLGGLALIDSGSQDIDDAIIWVDEKGSPVVDETGEQIDLID